MYATYPTDYDLAVAADRLRDLQNQAKSIKVAQAIRPASKNGPSLLDRLFAFTRRGTAVQAPRGKVGAAA
jgi:hypothetical protein